MTPDDNETTSDTDDETTDSSNGPVRDPETGKFLSRDDGGDEVATADDTAEPPPTAPDESGGAEPGESRSGGPDRGADEQPTPSAPASGRRSDSPGQLSVTLSRRTVFVTNPDGYPRPPTTYLPVVPWLRLPSHPPAHDTVTLQTASR